MQVLDPGDDWLVKVELHFSLGISADLGREISGFVNHFLDQFHVLEVANVAGVSDVLLGNDQVVPFGAGVNVLDDKQSLVLEQDALFALQNLTEKTTVFLQRGHEVILVKL